MKKTEKHLGPKQCVDVNLILLKWGAVFPFDNFSSSTWINITYKCYMIFNVMLFSFVSFFMPGFLLSKDCCSMEDTIEVISIMMTQIRSGMKLMTFIFYRKEIRNLIKAIYKNFYIRGKELDDHESRIVHEAIKNGRRVSIGYFSLVSSTVVAMLLNPLTIKQTEMDQEGVFNGTEVPRRILPFKLWFPYWNPATSPQYEIEYVVQIMITTLEGWFIGAVDSFCATIMILVGCQFDLLCNSLTSISKDTSLKSEIETHTKGIERFSKQTLILDKNSTLFMEADRNENKTQKNMNDSIYMNEWHESNSQDKDMEFEWEEGKQILLAAESCEQNEREAITCVKECIAYHQSLLIYVADVNKCFSTMYFILFLTASLLLCLLGFQVIVMPPEGMMMFARVVLHSLCTVFELAFFCWFGSDVMYKSENVYQAAYDSGWQNHSKGLKQLIGMMIMMAQRPVAVQAGFFGELSLPMYNSLMTNAYSYMAILRKFNEGDEAS